MLSWAEDVAHLSRHSSRVVGTLESRVSPELEEAGEPLSPWMSGQRKGRTLKVSRRPLMGISTMQPRQT